MEQTSDSQTNPPQFFRWWPRTRRGRIVLSALLALEFLICLFSEEFGVASKFYFALYSTAQVFLLCSAARYGYLKLNGKLQFVTAAPWWRNAGIGALAAMIILFVAFRPTSDGGNLKAKFQAGMNADRQTLFNWVHPVGIAKSITVHDVSVNNGPDGKEAVVRFTIYWQGPLTTDGFTKIRGIYDFETGRWVRGEVLSTNGTTNAQALDGISEFIAGFVDGALKE